MWRGLKWYRYNIILLRNGSMDSIRCIMTLCVYRAFCVQPKKNRGYKGRLSVLFKHHIETCTINFSAVYVPTYINNIIYVI